MTPMLPRPQLARLAAVLVSGAVAVLLSGCQAVVNSTSAAQVRVIDASPDAPGLDMYENSTLFAENLGFGTVTSYVPFNVGAYSIGANSAGTKQSLIAGKGTFAANNQYTVLIGNNAADLQELILTDQAQPAPTGQIVLRLLDQATLIGALDVYLVPAGQKFTAVTPLITNLTFSTNTGYMQVPTGTYTLVLVPTGTVPTSTTVATYTGAQTTYGAGSASTVILIDQQLVTTPGVQVITTQDYTSPTS